MDFLDSSVTLVVKAPNQKIEDQTVECAVDWTIKKLKAHLSDVYPSRPREHQQKLIYSGKLLTDQLIIKDVLRQYGDEPQTHTVHLVCAGQSETDSSVTQSKPHRTSQESSLPTANMPTANTTTVPSASPLPDGVRHRHPPHHTPLATGVPPPTYPQYAPTAASSTPTSHHAMFQQMYSANPQMMQQYYGGMPANMQQYYGPQQMAWMQQMYAQQMMQYMQFYQQGTFPAVPTSIPVTEAVAPEAAAQVAGNLPNVVNPGQARPANGAQPNQVMNAQGGGVMFDDEDEEGGNRDWLDWVYTLARMGVLLSIVYFYSTFSRFLFIFACFVFIYLYQAGMLRRRRRQQEEQQQPEQPQNQDADQQGQQDGEQPQEGEGERAERTTEGETGEGEEATDGPTVPAPPPPPPPGPGAGTVVWSFVSTFFSSLIPQQPGQVNAN